MTWGPRAVSRRSRVRAATAVLVAVGVVVPGLAGVPGAAATSPPVSIEVDGTLVAVALDGEHATKAYAVALPEGDVVPLAGVPGDPAPRSHFVGRLTLPSSVTDALRARGSALLDGERIDADTSLGQQALSLVDERGLRLRIAATTTLEPLEATPAPVTHHVYVARPTNLGPSDVTDQQVLTDVGDVAAYWEDQADGAIADVSVSQTVTPYTSTAATAGDCGLAADGAQFWDVVEEAAALFPGVDFFTGSDQITIVVPDPGCAGNAAIGRAMLGTSFANGGPIVALASPGLEGTLAHEAGHNYGFDHANLRDGTDVLGYYGIYDVMGFSVTGDYQALTTLSTPYRVHAGITVPGEIDEMPLGDGGAAVTWTRTIAPRDAESGLRSLLLTDPDTGKQLYLDYRAGLGEDAGSAYAQGISLVGFDHPYEYRPGVVMTEGNTSGGLNVISRFGRTAMVAGDTWTNDSGTLTIRVDGAAAGAIVTVDYSPGAEWTAVGNPTIGGDLQVGGYAELDIGAWDPFPTTRVSWFADGEPLPGTDDSSLLSLTPDLAGRTLTAQVTGFGPGLRLQTVTSAPVEVRPGTIPVTENPTVSGTPKVGSVLHGMGGSWDAIFGIVSFTWQWRRDGVAVPGATSRDYQLTAADAGSRLSLAQRLTAEGYEPVTIVSAPTAMVPVPVIAPAPRPDIEGTARVGDPLTVVTGSWMTGVGLARQWFRDGVPVPDATGATYVPDPADVGSRITVSVTGSRDGYADVVRTSLPTTAVSPGVLASSKPVISGRPKVGRRLTAHPGVWTTGTDFRYRWLAGGRKIRGATGPTLTLRKAQRHKRIQVVVTGRLDGYASRKVRSAQTRAVR